MKKTQPSNLEMQVLAVLWDQGPLSARQVMDSLPDGKERAYTSVLSVMQVMEKKGLLKHEAEGNRHIYAPQVKKRDVIGPFMRSMVARLFKGSATQVMQHLLDDTPVSETELREMRALLEARSGQKIKKEGKPQ